jgi:23S rRNA pseudouridine955/2504/2580 synthase
MSTHIITEDDHDIRLDRWFKRHLPNVTHGMLEKFLRKGDVRLEGKKAKSSDRLVQGQTLEIHFNTVNIKPTERKVPVKKSISPEDALMMQRAVLYKDANVIIINKPFGLAVQGGTGISKSVDDLLGSLMFDSKDRPKLVHRIDKDTTGILVLARSAKAAKILTTGFADKTIQKTYMALVHKQPLPPGGTIDKPLAKCAVGEGGFEKMEVDDAGKRAITEYQVIEMLGGKFSVMQLSPLTGRTHQLRVHMAEIGCPIVGDGKYGGKLAESAMDVENKLHLHAWRIQIPSMLGAKKIDITAPLPKHMQRSFDSLGIYVR